MSKTECEYVFYTLDGVLSPISVFFARLFGAVSHPHMPSAAAGELALDHVARLQIDVMRNERVFFAGASGPHVRYAHDLIVPQAGLLPGNPRFAPQPASGGFLRPPPCFLIGACVQFSLRFCRSSELCGTLLVHCSRLLKKTPFVLPGHA